MARIDELPDGQITTAARGVDAFLRPTDIQVAAPSQAPAFGNPKGMTALAMSGTPNVQGYNSSAQLAEALGPFMKELTQTTQNVGLAYAGWRMDEGEAQAKEAVRRAQAANDQSTEAGQLEYAAANRALSIKDPQAGWAMHLLDPYTQLGWERGKSKAAGQEIEAGMAGYVAKNSGRIDYKAPDQGFGALQRIRSEYIAEVTGKYGVSDRSHGFQKYAAPSIEKASERVAQAMVEDRAKFFDRTKPQELSTLLINGLKTAQATGAVEYKGVTYAKNSPLFRQALGARLNDDAEAFLATAGMAGMASKWKEEAYEILRAEADYNQSSGLDNLLRTLTTTDALKGADGKPVLDVNGEQVFLSWEQRYSKNRIDSQIKYEQAGFANRAAKAKDIGDRAGADIAQATQNMLPGPGRVDAGLAALGQFVAKENAIRQRNGQPLISNQELYQIRKSWKDANTLNSDLIFERDDPNTSSTYLGQLSTLQGSAFNAANERRKVLALSATIRDPAKRAQFQSTALNEIQQKEKEVQDFSAYSGPRDKVIKDNIESRIQRNYDARADYTKPDRVESERRQRTAYTSIVNDRIKAKEAQLQRKLSESEVRSVTQTAIDEYGSKDKDALQYLFPGSAAYPGAPSVDPATTMKSVPLGPDGKPKPNGGKPVPPVYEINQLDDIPNRRQELVQYQDKPVLSLTAVRQSFFDVMNGKPLSMKVERAWRDAGAPNPYVFLQRQLEMYPNYKGGEWTPAEMKKAKQKLTSDAALEGQSVSRAAMAPSMPMLASLGNWAGNTLLGIGPASAATYDTIAIRRGGGNQAPSTGSQGGAWRSSDSRGQSLIAMAQRNGWDPSDIAAIASFETGGTLNPSEPGRGAASGRIGLIQAGPDERRDYGLGTGDWNREMQGIENYLKARGAKPGMGLADLYATVNGGNPRAGYTADGNGTVARSASTLRALETHKQQALRKLGLIR
jgi:hypothetical protein